MVKALLLGNGLGLFLNWIEGLEVRNLPTKQSEVTCDSNPGPCQWQTEFSAQIGVKFPGEHMENESKN